MSIEAKNIHGKLNSSKSITGYGIAVKGETGNGIKEIRKTNSNELVDVYTIYYTNGTTSNFQISNGEKGDKGDQR